MNVLEFLFTQQENFKLVATTLATVYFFLLFKEEKSFWNPSSEKYIAISIIIVGALVSYILIYTFDVFGTPAMSAITLYSLVDKDKFTPNIDKCQQTVSKDHFALTFMSVITILIYHIFTGFATWEILLLVVALLQLVIILDQVRSNKIAYNTGKYCAKIFKKL